MGKEQSTLAEKGYIVEKAKDPNKPFGATKGGEKFIIKGINLNQRNTNRNQTDVLNTAIEILQISHPHIVSSKNSFTDNNIHYIVTDYCHGGNLDAKLKGMDSSLQECEVLSILVEICMAVKIIHEKNLLQKEWSSEDIHFTEYGIVCLNGFQNIYEKLSNSQSTTQKATTSKKFKSYLAPEVYTNGTYGAKSDIWTVGCILYELCTRKAAFSAKSTLGLLPMILSGPYPTLPKKFSPELCELLNHIFNTDPELRPTAYDIFGRPFIINFLSEKTKKTLDDIQSKVCILRALADDLERVHRGATIGSLAGGVIGAVGGVTSIVGLILAPFTLGASLIVTGIGVGVGAVGGVTAGASNIKNMVNQSTDRKAVRNVIKEIEHKINAVVVWLQEIGNGLELLKSTCDSANTEGNSLDNDALKKLGFRVGKGVSGIAELVRLVKVINVGKIAAQTARTVRVAEVATGVLSGLFVAVDIFFIAMDAKEIHNIRQAQTEGTPTCHSDSGSETESEDPKPSSNKSEIMRFVHSVRRAADKLQNTLDELKIISSALPLV